MANKLLIKCTTDECNYVAGVVVYSDVNYRLLMRFDHFQHLKKDLEKGLPLTNQLKHAAQNAFCLLCAKNILAARFEFQNYLGTM